MSSPCIQLISSSNDIPKSPGADVDLWEVEEDKGWLPDLEQLRSLIRPNTKDDLH